MDNVHLCYEYRALVLVLVDKGDVYVLSRILAQVYVEQFPVAIECALGASRREGLVNDNVALGSELLNLSCIKVVVDIIGRVDDHLQVVGAAEAVALGLERQVALVVRDIELWCYHPVVRLAGRGVHRV